MIDAARGRGVDVMADQMPTRRPVLHSIRFPSWALEGGQPAIAARLNDPVQWARIKREMIGLLAERGLRDLSFAVVASHAANPLLNGLNMAQVAAKLKGSDSADAQFEAARDLMLENGASMVYHFMSDQDVERIMRHPFVGIASDSSVLTIGAACRTRAATATTARPRRIRPQAARDQPGRGRPEDDVAAGRPFSLTNRGLLKEGYAADVVVFNPLTVADAATFEQPHAYAVGIPRPRQRRRRGEERAHPGATGRRDHEGEVTGGCQ